MIGDLVIGSFVIIVLLYLCTSDLAKRIHRNERKNGDNDDTNAV